MRRADRRGEGAFQLAALVDLLFVITFLLIWERESMMRKRVQKIRMNVKAAQEDTKKAEKEKQSAHEALKAAERDRKKAEDERNKLAATVFNLERVVSGDKSREKKLEKDLHHVFDWMIEGMRRQREGTIRGGPALVPGSTGSAETP